MRTLARMSAANADCPVISDDLEWQSRYDGRVMIAQIGGKAVAGISGPWSGQFALTWWDRPLPSRQLELYPSMEAAQQEVAAWAERMRTGGFSLNPVPAPAPLHVVSAAAPSTRGSSFIERVHARLARFAHSGGASSDTIDHLRRQRSAEPDISDLHFGAIE